MYMFFMTDFMAFLEKKKNPQQNNLNNPETISIFSWCTFVKLAELDITYGITNIKILNTFLKILQQNEL